MSRHEELAAPLAVEVVGWLAFLLFVGAVWKARQTLDRRHPGP